MDFIKIQHLSVSLVRIQIFQENFFDEIKDVKIKIDQLQKKILAIIYKFFFRLLDDLFLRKIEALINEREMEKKKKFIIFWRMKLFPK